MNLNKYFLSIGALIALSLVVFTSCKKKQQGVIPYVAVNIYIYPSDPNFNQLNVPGGWAYVNGGSKGIIVYRRSNEDFVAFDRHCPYLPENSCSRVSVNSTQITAVDTCCGSEFILTDGSPTKSPATVPLQFYQTSFNGNELRIYN